MSSAKSVSKLTNSIYIDCVTKHFYCSFLKNNIPVDNISIATNNNLTEMAAIKVFEMIERNKSGFDDLSKIYVVIGPGSFTGIRVGLMIAKMLYVLNPKITVYTATSLEVQIAHLDSAISLIDARSKKSYCLVKRNNQIKIKSALLNSIDLEQIIDQNLDLEICRDYADYSFRNDFHEIIVTFKKANNPLTIKGLYIKASLS